MGHRTAIDRLFYNRTTRLAMMAGRFRLAILALLFADLFDHQRKTPSSSGTLPTHSFRLGFYSPLF
jgi:K+-transporting ATPase A subunit